MTYRPPIKDPVSIAEDRPTGLCTRCQREAELERLRLSDEWLCPDCLTDATEL